jgi:hypothetical protein
MILDFNYLEPGILNAKYRKLTVTGTRYLAKSQLVIPH